MLHDKGFTRKDLAIRKASATKQEEEKIGGRNLADKALTAIANYKVALKYHDEYMQNGKFPSGKSLEDLLLYVRQKMFIHLKGAKNNNSNSKRAKNKQKPFNEEDMPVD